MVSISTNNTPYLYIGDGFDNEFNAYDYIMGLFYDPFAHEHLYIYEVPWIMEGRSGHDSLTGAAMGNDSLYGEDGNDTLDGDVGDDFVLGGRGDDYIVGDYSVIV